MAEQPVFRFHVTAELSINIAAAGKNSDKQVCRNCFASNGIFDWQCPACPVHFHGISGFMMDPHRGFGFFRPCPVNVTKLCILAWDVSGVGAIDLIFFPKQCQIYSFFRQFTVDPGTVWFQINFCFFLPFRIKQNIKLWICHLLSKWPPDPFLIRKPFYFSYGVAGTVQRSGDLSDVVSKALEPQDFAIIYHDHRPPYNDSHTNVCHHHYKNDFNHHLSPSEISDLNLRERWSV